MGISIQEILSTEYFRDFEVIAGASGLYKEVQGVATLEAPDGYKWTKGKELVLSSGYALTQDPECIMRAFEEGSIQASSGLMLKKDRYLNIIPERMIRAFNENAIPLILAPFSAPWMDITAHINMTVMNRAIRRFSLREVSFSPMSKSYKERKITTILQGIEEDMKFPACLYDIEEDTSYFSSQKFMSTTEAYGLELKDYWELSQPYTKHTLCEYIGMIRYRLINKDNVVGPRVSWVLVPIVVNGVLRAHFIVMESREFLDYYDEIVVRMAYVILQSMYEQVIGAKDAQNVGFDNLVNYALTCSQEDYGKLAARATSMNLNISNVYDYVLIRQFNPAFHMLTHKNRLLDIFSRTELSNYAKMVFLDETEAVIMVDGNRNRRESLEDALGPFIEQADAALPQGKTTLGICCSRAPLTEIRESIDKCRKVIDMGERFFPKKRILNYEEAGPLAWMNIPENELKAMLGKYQGLLADERNVEILRTLKVYLENNMNFSVTAEKMYVHINTIRKRIDRVKELIDIDWDNFVERTNILLLLYYMNL